MVSLEKGGREGEERRGFARTFIDVEFAEEDGFNHDERVWIGSLATKRPVG